MHSHVLREIIGEISVKISALLLKMCLSLVKEDLTTEFSSRPYLYRYIAVLQHDGACGLLCGLTLLRTREL